MARQKISVTSYMSPTPVTIGKEQPLAVAHQLMRKHRIRHLPVLWGGKVVGMVSMGDLHLIETLANVDPTQVTVAEAMSADPVCVSPSTPLVEVARVMAQEKYGSVVVLDDDNKVVGIVTTIDVCNAFVDALGESAA